MLHVYFRNQVPYALCESVEAEYKRLIDAKILEPVSNSDWAPPTVCVQKPAGRVRICGDYKRVNEFIEDDSYDPSKCSRVAKLTQTGNQPSAYLFRFITCF